MAATARGRLSTEEARRRGGGGVGWAIGGVARAVVLAWSYSYMHNNTACVALYKHTVTQQQEIQ